MLVLRPTAKRCLNQRYFSHVPVMADEIVQALRPDHGKTFIDMTFGGGGHSRRLLDTNKSIKIVAVDRDPLAIHKAHELASQGARKDPRYGITQSVIPVQASFSRARTRVHLSGIPFNSVDGIIFDLGASSMQYDIDERGFSLSRDAPLDMRMDTSNATDITAEDVVNNLDQSELAQVLKIYGGERRSQKIANAIVDARTLLGRIRTTKELAKIVAGVAGANLDAIGRFAHPATKTFQALRIFVNNELNELNFALEDLREFLKPKTGVAAVLSFHSLEDTIVKRHFSGVDPTEPAMKHMNQRDRIRTNETVSAPDAEEKNWNSLTKHVLLPSDEEVAANPRSRSAKLRIATRIM